MGATKQEKMDKRERALRDNLKRRKVKAKSDKAEKLTKQDENKDA